MQKVIIKLDPTLKFVEQIISRASSLTVEYARDSAYDLLITDEIPDSRDVFIIVWDKHDIKVIEQKILDGKNQQHRTLRGFFVKEEIRKDPGSFIESIEQVAREANFKKILEQKAEETKAKNGCIKIGSLVRVDPELTGQKLEYFYSTPRFTSLFIDKPMLKLMYQLGVILDEMSRSIERLEKDYASDIKKVEKTGGLDAKKNFDRTLLESLNKKRQVNPVRLDPILLTGDTGVGKTLIARWIHGDNSLNPGKRRFPGSFQEINSSGLSQTLLESELFGHVKGTFTDAKQDKPGKALLSLGGVLFLDEIGDMPLELQPRVMKFIEEKTFVPEGWFGLYPFYAPSLIVAATNKNLAEEVEKKTFRRDLYARFRHRVHIPSMEDRKPALNIIADFIFQNPLINNNGGIQFISLEAIEKLKGMRYEENFRGLERVLRDAAYKTTNLGLNIILPDVIASS